MPAPREDLEKVCGEAKNVKLENDLGRDPIRKLVLNIAIPSMLAQFVSVLYSIVDRIYIGNIPEIGNLALAGAGVCGPGVTMIGSVAFEWARVTWPRPERYWQTAFSCLTCWRCS